MVQGLCKFNHLTEITSKFDLLELTNHCNKRHRKHLRPVPAVKRKDTKFLKNGRRGSCRSRMFVGGRTTFTGEGRSTDCPAQHRHFQEEELRITQGAQRSTMGPAQSWVTISIDSKVHRQLCYALVVRLYECRFVIL